MKGLTPEFLHLTVHFSKVMSLFAKKLQKKPLK